MCCVWEGGGKGGSILRFITLFHSKSYLWIYPINHDDDDNDDDDDDDDDDDYLKQILPVNLVRVL